MKGVVLKPQPDATGRLWVQLGQPAAIAGIASGQFVSTSTIVLVAPAMLSRMLSNQTISKFLIEGAKISAKSGFTARQATTFTTRLTALLNKENIDAEITTL